MKYYRSSIDKSDKTVVVYRRRYYYSLIRAGKGYGEADTMEIKLFDSELKVMQVLWKQGNTPAREIAAALKAETGWNVNTTYTLIKRCIAKGAIQREEPGFVCRALIRKEEVQEAETNELIDKIYDGSADKLFAALLGRKKLSAEQIERLRQIVGELE